MKKLIISLIITMLFTNLTNVLGFVQSEESDGGKSTAPIWYEELSDGSKIVRAGAHGSWYVQCKDDEMEDHRVCSINAGWRGGANRAARAFVRHLYRRGLFNTFSVIVLKRAMVITIGYDLHPGTEVAVRVDEAKPIRFPSREIPSSTKTQRIIEQMKVGESYLLRWYEWPSRQQHDEKGNCSGFKEALSWAREAVSKYPDEPEWPQIKAPDQDIPPK